MDFPDDFQPRQIVYLENNNQRLYAEVIQVVDSRQMCWVRPLILVTFPSDPSVTFEQLPSVTDLRSTADLFWHSTLFRPALDTEVIPFLVGQTATEPSVETNPIDIAQLNQFVRRVWQAYQDAQRVKFES
ncbi:hypothetical protein [Gloeocapsopsis dulcis]|uniref:Uncharacterized protein n=1 Tax=Gloeocapsopsis dulcis AAB1 = 1H9 TaxID=1433147 RepID=A0A6N8FTK4_9CHRO|nr:hypothetical protein [Gloeocapsopsis dulcis]MUL36438.1 hypothetical protein [Gloeocapsopsis dulcis AAB1 = 1H9]WNN88066.1 hypothetical protein P0S91_17415 [Gloeocapsopsis dulcis]